MLPLIPHQKRKDEELKLSKVEQQNLRKTSSQRVGSYPNSYPKRDFKREGSTSKEKPKETTKPLGKDTLTPAIHTRDVKCFKCFKRGHVQAQCPNQRTLFLKGIDEYISCEDEPNEKKKKKEIEKPSEGLCESRKNEEYLTTSLTSIVKKEPLKEDCIDKYVVDYFEHMLRYHQQVRVKLFIGCLLYTSPSPRD